MALKARLEKKQLPDDRQPSSGNKCRKYECNQYAKTGQFLCTKHDAEFRDRIRNELLR